MKSNKWDTSSILRIILAIACIISITFGIINIYYSNNLRKDQPTQEHCAKAGESPISNLDMTTGKVNPNIKTKDCCLELKKIERKQTINIENSNICGKNIGTLNYICSPCGNNICDTQYEDHCNCPQDCKQ
ncbi:hypothetical protein GYA37_00880 [candidate division WWE3 bacterium]|uniref:Uncharacterized protein n=1 Tax=candidate division WWE3 bacterium TaxID=2053526 RepID=A0A7X9E6K1_UNCKA|nr:hypothetical protein [candidate division WWE3 bacterium]